jgi:starch synthase
VSVPVLAVAAELFPIVKTGGLADVAGALPAALAGLGYVTRTLIPLYPPVRAALRAAQEVHRFTDLFGGSARLLAARTDGAPELIVLDAPHLFDRPGGPYQSPAGADWPDNAFRFAALGWAARTIALGALADWRPAILHAHDWQAGLAACYLAFAEGTRPPTLFTVHNLAYQGRFPAGLLHDLRLPPSAWSVDGVEYYGGIGFLKAALYYSDALTTVSPTYAREIQTPEGGMGLDGLLRARAGRLRGIVNGIDEALWNPANDAALAAPYDASHLARREGNRAALRRRFALAASAAPLFCVISRLAAQKGIDLLLAVLPRLLALGAQLIVLGSGEAALEGALTRWAETHPGRIGLHLGYDEALAHLLLAGSDAIIIPSRFEPCGLTQLYGLRYGTVPIVARVGGLADTVIDANLAALEAGVATGIVFAPHSEAALAEALARAVALHGVKARWQQMMRSGMAQHLGWSVRAAEYAELYRGLLYRAE